MYESAAMMRTEPERASMTRRPERLLVVDTNSKRSADLRTALISTGFAVIGPTADPARALEMARDMNPDMAILDAALSAGDAPVIQQITRQMDIPSVLVGEAPDAEDLRDVAALPIYGIIVEPTTPDAVSAAIEIGWNRYLDLLDLEDERERLKQRLEDRKTIEQAKWLLVDRRKITEPDAMRLLQRQARNNRRTLIDVARAIIENENLLSQQD